MSSSSSSHRLAFCLPIIFLLFAVAYVAPSAAEIAKRPIKFGVTQIRIKHRAMGQYMNVVSRKRWPAATLGRSTSHRYVLYNWGRRGIRVKTLNSMYSGYHYLYSSNAGGLYFDLDRNSGKKYNGKQYWHLNKKPPLYDGDVVTFRNNWFDDSYLCYYHSYSDMFSTDVDIYCLRNSNDQWILEVV